MYYSPFILSAYIWHTKAHKLWKMNNLKQQTMEWISVKDRLPKTNSKFGESDYILCYTESKEQVVCWYTKNREWIVANFKADSTPLNIDITHWMPLPNPPSNE